LKNIEAKFKEERLNIQQNHSNEIQKILDRKNNEIEHIKQNFAAKRKEYEDNIDQLIKKCQLIKNESNLDRDSYEKQINDLKLRLECSMDKKQLESDKKLNDLMNKHEKEKLEMQKQHAKLFQDLIDETNSRLKKVEIEYNEQLNINDKVILELENKTQLLKNEIEKNIHVITLMEKQLNEKDTSLKLVEKKLHDSQARSSSIESELNKSRENHRKELHELNTKLESIATGKNREYETSMKRVKTKRFFNHFKSLKYLILNRLFS
jgi:centrosomal protein CEP112